jgi:type I restriction enzyme S subunit
MIDLDKEGNDLPKTWKWFSFKEIAVDHKYAIVDGPFGSNLKTSEYIQGNDGVPVLTTKNIDNGYSEELLRFISFQKFNELKRSEVKGGDIIIAKIGSVGKHTIYPNNLPSAIIPANLMKISLNKEVNTKYVNYYLDTEFFKDQLSKITTATAQPAFGITKFKNLLIPVPPFSEQECIVSKIDELFTQLDAAEAALKRAKNNLKRYKQSLLQAAVTGELTSEWREAHKDELEPASKLLERISAERKAKWESEMKAKGKDPAEEKFVEPSPPDTSDLPVLPDGWCWVTVQQIGEIGEQTVLTGPFGSTLGRKDFVSSGIPVLTIGCLTDIGLNLGKAMYITPEKAIYLGKYKVKSGDLLFSRMATVGRAGLVTSKFDGAIINYHLMRLRLAHKVILPEYFLTFVKGSQAVKNYVKHVNHGATRDGINTNQLLNLYIALPSHAEQKKLLLEIDQKSQLIYEEINTINKNLKRIENFRKSILNKAFTGKLLQSQSEETL